MPRKIRFEAVYPFPPEEVWIALTDSEAIAEWLMPNDFRPALGHRFQFQTKPRPGFDGVVNCEVTVLEPPTRLAYRWMGGGLETIVSFELSASGSGTKLVMEQSGFAGLRGMMVSTILKSGWKRIIEVRLAAAAGRVNGGHYTSDSAAADSQCETDS
ncbi:MAG: SRPBCC domain-containing protein [Rhizomicrobium sp.]|jgi:uncharacterized protein YndB with AHSA1/START domain